MAWIGVCYEGEDSGFLPSMVEKYQPWLKGDRIPRMFGENFIVIYDSNIAREFLKKIKTELKTGNIIAYTIPSILMEIRK